MVIFCCAASVPIMLWAWQNPDQRANYVQATWITWLILMVADGYAIPNNLTTTLYVWIWLIEEGTIGLDMFECAGDVLRLSTSDEAKFRNSYTGWVNSKGLRNSNIKVFHLDRLVVEFHQKHPEGVRNLNSDTHHKLHVLPWCLQIMIKGPSIPFTCKVVIRRSHNFFYNTRDVSNYNRVLAHWGGLLADYNTTLTLQFGVMVP